MTVKTEKPIAIYLPEQLDLEKIAELLPVALAPYAQYAGWFISQIQQVRIFNKMATEDYVPLKAAYLRKFFPTKKLFPLMKNILLGTGLIETDRRFVFGKKCLGYRLGRNYLGQTHRRIELTDESLVRKIRNHRNSNDKQANVPIHRWLKERLNELEIDVEGARAEIQKENPYKGDWNDACHQSVEMINNKDINYKVDEYGRVHSNLTNLWSGLRRHLRVRGERLVNLDIRNSQPLLFGIILKNYYRNQNGLISFNEFSKECLEQTKEQKKTKTIEYSTFLPPSTPFPFTMSKGH